MAKERDEFGEVKSNKAGNNNYFDEKTQIISSGAGTKEVKREEKHSLDDAEKTRLVFSPKKKKPHGADGENAGSVSRSKTEVIGQESDVVPCVGWLVVWEGPGKGSSHILRPGDNSIGRDEKCDVVLTHGDQSISSDGKISIDYEYRGHTFAFINRGSKNTPYLNDKPIRTESGLVHGDMLLIGETKLVFIPFCNTELNWS